MTVRELIEKLEVMNPELHVYIPVTEEEYERVVSVYETELGDPDDESAEAIVVVLNPDREA
jgi:hypothetical protein